MRLSELAHLTVDDVELPWRIIKDPDNIGSAQVWRKGDKIERIPLNYKACQAIATYLKVRPNIDEAILFISEFGRPMSGRTIEHIVTKYLKEAAPPAPRSTRCGILWPRITWSMAQI